MPHVKPGYGKMDLNEEGKVLHRASFVRPPENPCSFGVDSEELAKFDYSFDRDDDQLPSEFLKQFQKDDMLSHDDTTIEQNIEIQLNSLLRSSYTAVHYSDYHLNEPIFSADVTEGQDFETCSVTSSVSTFDEESFFSQYVGSPMEIDKVIDDRLSRIKEWPLNDINSYTYFVAYLRGFIEDCHNHNETLQDRNIILLQNANEVKEIVNDGSHEYVETGFEEMESVQCDIGISEAMQSNLDLDSKQSPETDNQNLVIEAIPETKNPQIIMVDKKSANQGKGKYICDVCGKGYTRKYGLNNHKKTHIVKPHKKKCHICKRAVGKKYLQKHIKEVHKITP